LLLADVKPFASTVWLHDLEYLCVITFLTTVFHCMYLLMRIWIDFQSP
jgi:hypothetical protein